MPAARVPARDAFVSVDEAAEMLWLTPQTIRNWIKAGRLAATRYGRNYRVLREDVEAIREGNSPRDMASAEGASSATHGDVWSPETLEPPRRRDEHGAESPRSGSVWDDAGVPVLLRRRKRPSF